MKSHLSSKGNFTLSPIEIPTEKPTFPTSALFDLPRSITVVKNGEKFEIQCQSLEVENEVRRGAFGVVEVMRHIESDVRLAVKTIPVTDVEKEKKYLSDEIKTMKQANSPFMVFCYGVMFWECRVWICMEIMDLALDQFYGQCFDQEIKIPEYVLSYIAYCIISGLQYMETELEMMHRDVKPTNILLNHTGEVKLCDFGISASLRESIKKTIQAGCKPYMAPEKIHGSKQDKYDCKSDVWSFGITMIETATGNYPYDKWLTIFEMLRQVVDEPSPTLPEDGGFSKNFHNFVNSCLLKECGLRPTYEVLLEHDWIKCQDDKNVKRFIENFNFSGTMTKRKSKRAKPEPEQNLNKTLAKTKLPLDDGFERKDGESSKTFPIFFRNDCLMERKLRPAYDSIKCQNDKNVKKFIVDIIDAQKKAMDELPPYDEFECMTVADLK